MMTTEQNHQFPGEVKFQSCPRKKMVLDASQLAWLSKFYPITETRAAAERGGKATKGKQ